MVRSLGIMVVLIVTSGAIGAAAQPGGTLFISPCGQPFRAAAGQPYPVGAWFEQVDVNKDGAIDAAELRSEAAEFFKVLDRDKDDVIESYEVAVYERVLVPEIAAMAYGAADPAPRLIRAQIAMDPIVPSGSYSGENAGRQKYKTQMVGAAAFGLLGEPQPVTAADADFNGRITLREFEAASDRRFKRLDANGDGKITRAELPATYAQRMSRASS